MGMYVRVPEQDWKNICNSTRNKTGGTDLLKSGAISPAIDSIQTGGGGGASPEWFNDGNTHIWITLGEGRTSPMLGCCPRGTVTVDWGDGTEPVVLTGTGGMKWTPTHEYAKPGDYVISLSVDGTMGFYGTANTNGGSGILRYTNGSDKRNIAYQGLVRKIEIGSGVNSISTSSVQGAFYNCHSLASVRIPDGVTLIAQSAFYNCHALASVRIPDGVTEIGTNAFYNCYGVRYYDFSACTSVPALMNTITFNGIPSDCQMLIPSALYDEWSTATNWATYASYMVAV